MKRNVNKNDNHQIFEDKIFAKFGPAYQMVPKFSTDHLPSKFRLLFVGNGTQHFHKASIKLTVSK
jgi:hypothetical protein